MNFREAALKNHVLAALPAEELERLEPHLLASRCNTLDVLYDVEQPIEYVFFPETVVVSHLSVGERRLRDRNVGRGPRGIVGLSILHGVGIASERAIVQGAVSRFACRHRHSRRLSTIRPISKSRRIDLPTRSSPSCRRGRRAARNTRSKNGGARWLLVACDRRVS